MQKICLDFYFIFFKTQHKQFTKESIKANFKQNPKLYNNLRLLILRKEQKKTLKEQVSIEKNSHTISFIAFSWK